MKITCRSGNVFDGQESINGGYAAMAGVFSVMPPSDDDLSDVRDAISDSHGGALRFEDNGMVGTPEQAAHEIVKYLAKGLPQN